MELDQLRLFVDLVREQSFTRVAARNFITQPAVSLSMQRLEEELGVRLLERTTRKVLVTEEGRVVYDYAREILEKLQELRTALQERQDQVQGTVRLSTIHSIGLYELPAPLKEYIRRYPNVQLHIEYKLSEQVYQSVQEGDADLGLVAYPEERGQVVTLPFLEDELVVICSRESPLAGRDSVRLSELNGHPFVAFEPEIPTRRAVDALLTEHHVRVQLRMQCDNIEILKKMVEVGLGVSFVPLLSVQEEVRTGAVSVLRVADVRVRRPVAILYRKGKSLTRAQQAFLDLLTSEGEEIILQSFGR